MVCNCTLSICVLHCVARCCSVLQCVAVTSCVLQLYLVVVVSVRWCLCCGVCVCGRVCNDTYGICNNMVVSVRWCLCCGVCACGRVCDDTRGICNDMVVSAYLIRNDVDVFHQYNMHINMFICTYDIWVHVTHRTGSNMCLHVLCAMI